VSLKSVNSKKDKNSNKMNESQKRNVDINNIESFPQGKDTILSREFGGLELSGGE
jgi:hypothetical protein